MENDFKYVTYGDDEIAVVKSGITAIQTILMGIDNNKKRSLLFALDWFMDPFYKQNIVIAGFRDDLKDLLQILIISSHNKDVVEDAINLLFY